jgi:arylsulfatase A-like enzyme
MRLSLLALVLLTAAAQAALRPNIVFILADDLGIGDVGVYGQTKIKTPNIDRIAAEGMRFTNFYSGSAVCAPSRCTLVTGKHTGHSAVRDNLERGRTVEGQQPMPRETKTIAQMLHAAGYFTGIIGKWGLGMPEEQSGPNDFGFDYSYGYLCQRVAHTYYPDHLWRNQQREALPGNPPTTLSGDWQIEPGGQTYSHDLMAADALRFVRDRKAAPFFLYLAFTIPHVSLQVPEEALAEYQFEEVPIPQKHYSAQARPRAAYAAMVSRMDRDIGRLMTELKAQGVDENTLVIFTSDNGVTFSNAEIMAKFFSSNAGLRGMKGDLYEGGIRTPFLARWPGRIAAGSTSAQLGAFWDMMPTFGELAGAPGPVETDGISIVPALLGKTAEQKQHEFLYWEYHSGGSSQAVRMGPWKGIRTGVKKNPQAPVELYELASDPAEMKDVAGEHPEVVEKVKAALRTRTRSEVAAWNF